MEKLLKNALAQLKKNGKIVVTIYENRDYNNPCDFTCQTFHEAVVLIQNVYFIGSDDIHVSAF